MSNECDACGWSREVTGRPVDCGETDDCGAEETCCCWTCGPWPDRRD